MTDTTTLIPRTSAGRLGGFAPLWQSEWRRWWQPRSVIINLLVWVLLCYGFSVLTMVASSIDPAAQADVAAAVREQSGSGSQAAMFGSGGVNDTLFISSLMTLFFTTVGAIVAGQDKLIGERQNGLMASTLARPVSRSAYLLAKFAALPGMLLTMVLIPFALIIPTAGLIFGEVPRLTVMIAFPLLIAGIVTAFYSLTLMLGTLFERRAAVLGISLVVTFSVMQVLPQLLTIAPLTLTASVATAIFLVAAIIFAIIGIVRFERMELR